MNIGLIAHDAKKKLMQNFCIAYRGILCKHNLYATGTTGRLIAEVTNLNVHKYLAGHLGGEQQLRAAAVMPLVLDGYAEPESEAQLEAWAREAGLLRDRADRPCYTVMVSVLPI